MPTIKYKSWITLFTLIFAGEMVFSLPFHIARFFRPTFLGAFKLTNTELGDIILPYGILGMLSYFPGGFLADRFSARKLMSISLLATAIGGVYMSTIPGITGMSLLFAWWGISTIFLFWSPLIKATRKWGGNLSQGKAFGFLDGGRGLFAALLSSIAVYLLSLAFGENINNIDENTRIKAIKSIIWLYTAATTLAAILCWFFIPDTDTQNSSKKDLFKGFLYIVKDNNTWKQALIIVSAYTAYKSLDFYSLYGINLLNMNEVEASSFVSNASYLRAVGAIAAGFLVDKFSGKKIVKIIFTSLILVYLAMTIINPGQETIFLILANLLVSFTSVYALRGVYFTLVQESGIPYKYTGSAVGIISVIGFTPDAFLNSLAGRILDGFPGLMGFKVFFAMLLIFSIAGLIATIMLNKSHQIKQ